MEETRLCFREKIKRTGSVESFRFGPVRKVSFLPGQAAGLVFDEKDRANRELNKYLSFSSSPEKDYVEFTKRLSNSQFSRALKNLKSGDEVLIKAPIGNCVFSDSYKKIGFLIGGIGITPVISIIEYIMDKKLDTEVMLLYSNRTDEDIAFKPQLDSWQALNKNIRVYYMVTDCQPQDKTCIQGRIDKNIITDTAGGIDERVIFIFGPPKMVEAMSNLCTDLGCNKENIKTERFVGY